MKSSVLYLKLITVISTPNAFYEMLICLFVFAVDVVDDDGCCCAVHMGFFSSLSFV